MKRIYSFLFASATTLMLVGCDKAQDKPEPTPPTPKTEVTTHTVTPQGGNFDYKGDIKLVIPKDGVKENTQIEAKYTDVNKALGLGSNFVSTGRDIVLKLDAQSISKAFSIEFTAPEGFDLERTIATLATETKEEVRALGHHLSERIVLPNLDYSKDNKITLRIDNLIELKEKGKLSKDQEYYLQLIIDKRITAKEQRGIKRISFDGGNMTFQEPGELSGKRCLLFVHGWTANPKSCWEKFAKFADLDKVKKDYNYDVILTFGYNSGLRVDKNGATLANEIKKLLANSTLDIVAHSMGGLVSRSAIENHKAFPYVRSLVTLGTPHLGARLATLKLSKGLDVWYNLSKEGGQDLSETSDFIRNLAKNAQPAETNYYFIAGRISTVTTEFITGAPIPTDGVVGVNSAFNASTNEDKTEAFDFYKITLAHSLLTEDSRVILHTLDKLREFANTEILRNTILEDDFSGQNLDLQKWDSKSDRIRVDNGILKMEQNITDEAVDLQTRQMFKAEKWVKLSRRVYIYHSNSQSYPFVTFEFPKIQERVALHYANYAYENLYGVICSHGNIKTDWHSIRRPFYVSEKLGECITNSWFNEEIYISFQDKKIVYTRDGKVLREVLLPMLKNSVFSIKFNPYGWYTGHKHYMDDFKLEVR